MSVRNERAHSFWLSFLLYSPPGAHIFVTICRRIPKYTTNPITLHYMPWHGDLMEPAAFDLFRLIEHTHTYTHTHILRALTDLNHETNSMAIGNPLASAPGSLFPQQDVTRAADHVSMTDVQDQVYDRLDQGGRMYASPFKPMIMSPSS